MEVIIISVAVALSAVVLLAVKMQKDVNAKGGCPECGEPVPVVRHPTSWRQALWGGWTCSACSTEMDRHGRELTQR